MVGDPSAGGGDMFIAADTAAHSEASVPTEAADGIYTPVGGLMSAIVHR